MRRSLAAVCIVASIGCATPDSAVHERLLSSDSARRLVGVWDVTLTADTTSMALRLRPRPAPVTGTVVFALNHHGASANEYLHDITHEGVYDLDVSPFGFTTREGSDPSVAVALVASRPGVQGDSLWIVLSPEGDRFALSFRGVFGGDSATGVWSAESYTANGGTGRFVMRRHASAK